MASPTPFEILRRRRVAEQERALENPGALAQGFANAPGTAYRYLSTRGLPGIGQDVVSMGKMIGSAAAEDPMGFAADALFAPLAAVRGVSEVRALARQAREAGDDETADQMEQLAAMSVFGAIPVAGAAVKRGVGAAAKKASLAAKPAKAAAKKASLAVERAAQPYFAPGSPERAANLARFMEGSVAPPTLYHGTPVHGAPMRANTRPLGDIDQFDRYAAYKAFNSPEGMDAVGSWLSEGAGEFGADMYGGGLEGAIYPIHASLKNPWKPKSFDEFLNLMHTTAGRNPKAQNPKGRGTVGPLRDYLTSKGHDSILFPPGVDDRRAPPVWVALHPERQLKSAIGNRGTFDLNEPEINKAHGGRVSSLAVKRKGKK